MYWKQLMTLAATALLSSHAAHAADKDWKPIDRVPADAKVITASMPIFGQRFVHRLPRGWKPAFEKTTGGHYIIEYLPEGQTVETWEEMITVQGFKDLARNEKASAKNMLGAVAAQHEKLCGERRIVHAIGDRAIDGHEAFAAAIGCGGLPADHPSGLKKGRGEVAYYVAIKGAADMYLIHRAARFAEGADPAVVVRALAGAIRELEPIKLCDLSVSQATCWERPPR